MPLRSLPGGSRERLRNSQTSGGGGGGGGVVGGLGVVGVCGVGGVRDKGEVCGVWLGVLGFVGGSLCGGGRRGVGRRVAEGLPESPGTRDRAKEAPSLQGKGAALAAHGRKTDNSSHDTTRGTRLGHAVPSKKRLK